MTAKLGRAEKNEVESNLLRSFNVDMGLSPGSEHPFNEESPSFAYSADSVSQRKKNRSGFLYEKFNIPRQAGWTFLFLPASFFAEDLKT